MEKRVTSGKTRKPQQAGRHAMDNEKHGSDDSDDDREVVHFQMPGLSIRITERTLQTIGQYTGKSWMAVVFAVAISIIIYAVNGFTKGEM